MHTAFAGVKRYFAERLEKHGVYSSHSPLKRAVSLQGFKNEAYFVYAALVWGKIYYETSNSDGHEWTPLDSHGSHRIPFDK